MTYILCFQTPLSFYRSISVELFFLLIQPRPQASLPGRGGVMGLIIRGSLGVVGLLRTRKGTPCRFCWVSWQKCSISCQKLFSRLYQRHMATNHRWKVRGNYYCQRADFRCHSDRFVAVSCKIFSAFTWANVSRYDSTIRMAGNPDRRLIMKKENPAFRAARSSNGGWRSCAGIRRLSLR